MTAVAGGSGQTSFRAEALPHLDAVFGFALRLTGQREAARDLTQETFLRAYRSWHQYTPGTRCRSWLFTIARNAFLQERAKEERRERALAEAVPPRPARDDPGSRIWASASATDPEGTFFASIVDRSVRDAIDALPEEFRTAVLLCDVDGLEYAEIAEVLGVPIGTVKSRLYRGRRALQEALYDYALEMGYVRPRRDVG